MKYIVFIAGLLLITSCEHDSDLSTTRWMNHRSIKELDGLLNEVALDIASNFKSIPPQNLRSDKGEQISRIGLWQFEGDVENRFYNNFRAHLLQLGMFRVYERKDIANLLKELNFQENDIYSKQTQKRLGNLTQWNGLIYGKITVRRHHLGILRDRIYLRVECHFNNIEDGLVVWSQEYTKFKRINIIYGLIMSNIVILIAALAGDFLRYKSGKESIGPKGVLTYFLIFNIIYVVNLIV